MKDVGYRKIYGIIESGLLERMTKRSFEDNKKYIDIVDFDEFDLTVDEEEFLVDCLRQFGIEVYDRHGRIYGEDDIYNTLDEDLSMFKLITKYRKTGDRSYVEGIERTSFEVIKMVVKQLVKKYGLNQTELESMGFEYILYLIDECPIEKVDNLFNNLNYGIVSYIINEIVNNYKIDKKTNKLIEEYTNKINEMEDEEKVISLLIKQNSTFRNDNVKEVTAENEEVVNDRFSEFGMSLSDAISLLSSREQRVISLRLGLTGKYYSQEDVAKDIGRTVAYVSKVEKNVMEKLKMLVVKEIYEQALEDLEMDTKNRKR